MTTYDAIYGSKSVKETLEVVDYALAENYQNGVKNQTDRWDIRDARIIAQRAYYYLDGLEMCEPKLFTKQNAQQLAFLRDFIKECKEQEERLKVG